MNLLVTRHILNGDLSYSINVAKDTCTDHSIDFELFVFARKCSVVDAEFQYQINEASEWKSDANLTMATCKEISGNVLSGVECGIEGERTRFTWNFSDNDVIRGQDCNIRIILSPNSNVFSFGNVSYYLEQISFSGTGDINTDFNHNIVDINFDGNYICISDDSVYILDSETLKTEEEILVSDPVFAHQKSDENFLVLHDDGDTITEFTLQGAIINVFSNATYLNGAMRFSYNRFMDTLLMASPDTNYVLEISTSQDNFGDVLWTHGDGNSGPQLIRVNAPLDAQYDPNNFAEVYIADTDNDRVLFVDRNTDSKMEYTDVEVEGKTVEISQPYEVSVLRDGFIVVERERENAPYAEERLVHPSILRHEAAKTPSITDTKNAIGKYNNMLFTPIKRAIG